jgi:hypothetical protein
MAAARPVILQARKHGRYTKNAIEERNELIRSVDATNVDFVSIWRIRK